MKFARAALLLLTTALLPSIRADRIELAWQIAPGERSYMTTGNTERGIAFNKTTGHLLLVSRAAGALIYVLDAATGNEIPDTADPSSPKTLNMTDVGGGTFAVSMIGIGDDGVIYAANLTTGSPSTPFKVYRWADEDAAPTVAYSGDPGSGATGAVRWGDSFDVRGAGADTQFIAGAGASAHVAIFTTTDGENFSHTTIAGAATSSGSISVAFGEGNTGWSKRPNIALRHFSFDLASGNATLLHSFTINPLTSIGFSGKYFGAVAIETPDNARLYDVSDLSVAPILVGQLNFPADNSNGNAVGSVEFGGTSVFFLDTNNGLIAANIVPEATPVSIATQPANTTVIETGRVSLSVAAQGTPPIQYQWTHAGTNISWGTAATLTLTNAALEDAGEYQVVVSNSAGPVTSDPATLTVTPIVRGTYLTPKWKILPDSRPWISSDNGTRGITYNKASNDVLVVSRTGLSGDATAQIEVLDADTGADRHTMTIDPTIVTGPGGSIAFSLNMIGVADDGAVYAANLTSDSGSAAFAVYRWPSEAADAAPELVYLGDPSNGSARMEDRRFGDTFDVRGAGENTQILVGSRNGNIASIIFPNSNPSLFSATAIQAADAPDGSFGLGIAFGEGNSFYGTSSSALVRLITFDDPVIAAGTIIPGTIAKEYTSAEIPLIVGNIAFDVDSKSLAGIAFEVPDDVRLYKIADDGSASLIDQEVFEFDNSNLNGTGSLDFGGGKLFALDTNNGIVAYDFNPAVVPIEFGLSIASIAANGDVTIRVNGAPQTYEVQATSSLTPPINWSVVGAVTTDASGSGTIIDTPPPGQATRFYRVSF